MIKLTPSAEQQIKTLISRRQKGIGVRLGVKTTGCSGLAYVFEYVDQIQPGDFEQAFAGFMMFIDPKSLVYLSGTTVDFVRNGLNEGFEFSNPNEQARCGCGESFTVR